jgi:hypothetical protein
VKNVVVVMPVYEDAVASTRLFAELKAVLGEELFVVAVDDGSVHQPLSAANLTSSGVDGIVLTLKRNVGHQNAIAVGLHYVAKHWPETPFTVVMDSDGEDVPSTIPALIQAAQADTVDLAVSKRKSRVESLQFKAFYLVYKKLFQFLSGRTIGFGNFMVLKPAALKRLTSMDELPIHVAGCVLLSKLRIAVCPLDRGPRYAGQSKMNFVGLALHGFRALMIFAEDVLVRVGIGSTFLAGFTLLAGLLVIVMKVVGAASPGWFSIALGILGVTFLQVGSLAFLALMCLMLIRRPGGRGPSGTTLDLVGRVDGHGHS